MKKTKDSQAVKRTMCGLDNKYFNLITSLISSYIEEYMNILHPEMNQDEIDEIINYWANAWYSELTCNLLEFEDLPSDSFDSGAYIG